MRLRRAVARGVRPGRLPDQQRLRDPADGPDHPDRADAAGEANETNVFAPLRLSALFADALAASKGSIIMLNSCVVYSSAAGVRRLQALQGHARAPRLVAGHRARPARHPGQQRRAVLHLRGRQQAYFDWLAAVEGTTHEEIYRQKAAPTDLKRLASPRGGRPRRAVLRQRPGLGGDRHDAQRRLRRVPQRWSSVLRSEVTCGGASKPRETKGDLMCDNVMTRERADVGRYEDIVAAAERTTGHDATSAAPPTRRACGSWSRTWPRPRPG